MTSVVETIKLVFHRLSDNLTTGLNNADNAIHRNHEAIKNSVPVIKLIASLVLLTIALSFSQLSFGLTISFTATSMLHNLTDFSPLKKAAEVFNNLWYTAFGNPPQNHQTVFALGVVASLVAPGIVVPILAGSMIGDQLSTVVRSV